MLQAEAWPAGRRFHCLFETGIGCCGIAWSGDGITRLQLPESDPSAAEARLRSSGSVACAEPPQVVEDVILSVRRHADGQEVDYSAVVLDLTSVPSFHRDVYEAARRIGWGETATYGELACATGAPKAARAVGHALSRNPVAIIVPCHRIVAVGGRLGGFSAFGGPSAKARLLALEGVRPGTDAPLLPGIDLIGSRA
jgi:methylated-DNA-[protein]-cysteine S-methyltransferase